MEIFGICTAHQILIISFRPVQIRIEREHGKKAALFCHSRRDPHAVLLAQTAQFNMRLPDGSSDSWLDVLMDDKSEKVKAVRRRALGIIRFSC